MSLSDLTFSSPRKALSDKSDDEFEKFLNDSSLSDISSKYKKINKKSSEPWWMTNDNEKQVSASASKSFIKKPKPKLLAPLESDEANDLTNITQQQTPVNRQSTYLSKDSLDDVGRTKTQEIKLTLPEASFESTQESTIQVIKSKESKNYEDEEEEEKSVSDNKNKYLLSDRNSSIRNDKDASLLSSDRKQEKQMNKLIEFEEQKQQNKNLETLSSTKGEHLLSKVILMDSLENTMLQTALNDSKLKPQVANKNLGTKKTLKVQISEDRIEHEINDNEENQASYEDDYEKEDDNEEHEMNSPKSQNNGRNPSDTQTRNDFEELEEFYRKNLQQNTNFNTLTTQQNVDDVIRTLLGTSKPSSTSNNNDSLVGLQAVHIRKELEEQTLKEVLKELNKYERPPTRRRNFDERPDDRTFKKLNNKKFKHVKSSGYANPNWSPVRLQSPHNLSAKSFNNESLHSSKSYLSIEVDDAQIKTQKNDTLEFKKRINNLMEERENDKNSLNELKEEFSKREKDFKKALDMQRVENERITQEFKQKIEYLETKLSENVDNNRMAQEKVIKTDKTSGELENLLKNYQTENERLYNEVKLLNEKLKLQKQKFDIDLQKLQIELINKNLIIENNKQMEKFKDNETKPTSREITKVKFQEKVKNEEIDKPINLEQENKQLKDKIKFFEINQKFIEDDVALIDLKNKEIKKLNEKIKLLEHGKNVPENMKKLRDAQVHVRELEQIVKRLRTKPSPGGPPETGDLLLARIDYYEKRIDLLEKNVQEKTKDYERLNRMWHQKYEILKAILDENNKEFSLNEKNFSQFDRLNEALNVKLKIIDENYHKNLSELEAENIELKKIVNKVESDANKKLSDLSKLNKSLEEELLMQKNDFKMLLNKYENTLMIKNQQQQNKKEYEPKIFKDNPILSDFSQENAKLILDENARLKQKYSELEIEFKKRVEQFDFTLEQIKEANTIQIETIKNKYKVETETLLQSLFGLQSKPFNMNDDNLLKQIRMKFIEMKQSIEEKEMLSKNLNEKCIHLEAIKEKCLEKTLSLEKLNKNLHERIDELNNELKTAKLYYSPEMQHYEALNNKLKSIEVKYKKREKELNDLMHTSNYNTTVDSFKEFDEYNLTNSVQVQKLVQYYKNILEKKDAEILKFRFELDSILELLNSLQIMTIK